MFENAETGQNGTSSPLKGEGSSWGRRSYEGDINGLIMGHVTHIGDKGG